MPTIPQERFSELLHVIEPSPRTKRDALIAHTELRQFLQKDEEFSKFYIGDFLTGSYARDTAIQQPKTGDQRNRPDVDIIVVTNHTISDDPREVVDLLFITLKKRYVILRKQVRSVRIEYDRADMDVVPVVPYGDMYKIPDRKLDSWFTTNPPMHIEWANAMNRKSGGRFKPLVKLLKWWRHQNLATIDKISLGFVFEVIAADCMDLEETYYGALFVRTLECFVEKYRTFSLLQTVPPILNPAVPEVSVLYGMSERTFGHIYNTVKEHAELGRQALGENDPEEATKLWRKIFGYRFPKTYSS